ncbi:hypothetical protein [Sphingobacterium suaedae]|uniref:Uncharacterized protein n=1 Tax=Sphingobacterium suaedae TaxID=1686402 RepID=A0ABW5KF84_9SPHI
MDKKKIHRKDLAILKAKIEVDCIMVDNKPINLTPVLHASIQNYCTHDDCKECGIEFEKKYTHDLYCDACLHKRRVDRYKALELVEWDGETPLVIFGDDQYFFNEDDIISYCEDNECQPNDLMLVVCRTSNLSQIDWDHWMDEVHEDWEPSAELTRRLIEFNEFLSNEPSNTWFEGKKRVTLDLEVPSE